MTSVYDNAEQCQRINIINIYVPRNGDGCPTDVHSMAQKGETCKSSSCPQTTANHTALTVSPSGTMKKRIRDGHVTQKRGSSATSSRIVCVSPRFGRPSERAIPLAPLSPLKCHNSPLSAALAPNSCDVSFLPAKSSFIIEWASSLLPQRSRYHQISSSPGRSRLVTIPVTLYFSGPQSIVGKGRLS
jgi:hypothetical protein